MKLKEQYINAKIFIPNIRQTMVGKFIPEKLYPMLYKKYPDFFELEPVKTTKKNALPINDPVITTDNNTTEDNNSDSIVL